MAEYRRFTRQAAGNPDQVALLAAVRAACGDGNAGCGFIDARTVQVKKADAWTAQQISATQAAVETCPSITPQRLAQNEIDSWPIATKALVLALIDQINVLRAGLPSPLPPVTVQQALAAIRNKAATL